MRDVNKAESCRSGIDRHEERIAHLCPEVGSALREAVLGQHEDYHARKDEQYVRVEDNAVVGVDQARTEDVVASVKIEQATDEPLDVVLDPVDDARLKRKAQTAKDDGQRDDYLYRLDTCHKGIHHASVDVRESSIAECRYRMEDRVEDQHVCRDTLHAWLHVVEDGVCTYRLCHYRDKEDALQRLEDVRHVVHADEVLDDKTVLERGSSRQREGQKTCEGHHAYAAHLNEYQENHMTEKGQVIRYVYYRKTVDTYRRSGCEQRLKECHVAVVAVRHQQQTASNGYDYQETAYEEHRRARLSAQYGDAQSRYLIDCYEAYNGTYRIFVPQIILPITEVYVNVRHVPPVKAVADGIEYLGQRNAVAHEQVTEEVYGKPAYALRAQMTCHLTPEYAVGRLQALACHLAEWCRVDTLEDRLQRTEVARSYVVDDLVNLDEGKEAYDLPVRVQQTHRRLWTHVEAYLPYHVAYAPYRGNDRNRIDCHVHRTTAYLQYLVGME